MLKKWIVLGLCLMGLSGPLLADNIGYIDMKIILSQASAVKNFEKEMSAKQESYEKIFKEKQEKLEKAKKKGKSDAEIEKIITKFEEELRPKQEEMARMDGMFRQSFLAKINALSKVVAKEYGIDVVLNKDVIYYGGFDLTGFILEKINK